MKLSGLCLLSFAILTLGGCRTLDALSNDIDNTFNLPANTQSKETLTAQGGLQQAEINPCPSVQIVDELSSLSEFTPSNKAEENNIISRVDLSQANSSCSFEGDLAVVDMTLVFQGMLGPKAKLNSSDKPFFSYPFFVAVTDPFGVVLAREVFSASMTYERNEKNHTYYEKLRQLIPIRARTQASRYKIMIGFQLDPVQLDYNRANMSPVLGMETPAIQPDYSGIKAEMSGNSSAIQKESLNNAPISVIPPGSR